MRANEFISEEQQLDEILPLLIGAAELGADALAATGARAVAGGVARKVGSEVAGKAAGKVAGNVGRAAGRGVVSKVASKISGTQPSQSNPNGVIGTQTQPNVKTSEIPPKPSTQRPTVTPALQDKAASAMTNLKPGVNLQLPTGTGRVGNFKISKVMGQNVEIENPDKDKNPNEPDKLVYNKDDLMKSMGVK